MVFSSPTFLFLFLPLVLAGTVLAGRRFRNSFLCAASLVFYAWGEPVYVLLMAASIMINYGFGLAIARGLDHGSARRWLAAGIAANLVLLGHFKYAGFLVDNANALFAAAGWMPIPRPEVALPVGISFFTFQALSYLADVYRREAPAEPRLVDLGLYISMFPQLVAGPIVRYEQVAAQLRDRVVTLAGFAAGVERFVIGLAKKMLLANPAGAIADAAFAAPDGTLTFSFAWLGVACYTVQIYFDFSGYSDMAIGLGRMFGFRYPENFRHPYCARSLREFWRRWHMSLSTWFRDYLYLPLGGSRHGAARTHRNLFIVFTLCGLWHGASWNFLFWGWLHGSVLVAERAGLGVLLARAPRVLQHAYLLLVVAIGWVLFRAPTLRATLDYFGAMAGAGAAGGVPGEHGGLFPALLLAVAAVAATPAGVTLLQRLMAGATARPGLATALSAARLLGLAAIFVASVSFVAADTYNPFIYYRF
jgi:alginate O-acetyltransferase complex protein AlgI